MKYFLLLFHCLLHFHEAWSSYSAAADSGDCISHYCECPPFLSQDPTSLKRALYFNKYPYPEHYAILGRAKELHCCIGGNFSSVSWYKDGEPYPWLSSNSPLPILFGRNQSLVIVNMTPQDEGQYRCVASNGGEEIHHRTMLRSYSMPNFQHLPIWNEEPEDQTIVQGQDLSLNCSATVGSQYNSVILQPVSAFWKDANGQTIDSEDTQTLQDVAQDEMVYGLTLRFRNATSGNAGKYTCVISNSYGVLTKTVRIQIDPQSDAEMDHPLSEATEELTLKQIFRFQSKIYESLIKLAQEDDADQEQILAQLREMEL